MYIKTCRKVYLLIISILLGHLVSSKPIKRKENSKVFGKANAARYLTKYGYLSKTTSDGKVSSEILADAIEDFQVLSGLSTTGQLDTETIKLMLTPRCGVPDQFPEDGDHPTNRKKRSPGANHHPPWNKTSLTYKLTKFTNNPSRYLSLDEINVELRKAFNFWEEKTNLTFTEAESGPVDIEIQFVGRDHGDGIPFEGPSTGYGINTLAHAFFPTINPVYGGDIHFDDEESWRLNGPDGINVLQIAVHEIGHSLGLEHSSIPDAVMYGAYLGYRENFTLHEDDIIEIQSLYFKNNKDGKKSRTSLQELILLRRQERIDKMQLSLDRQREGLQGRRLKAGRREVLLSRFGKRKGRLNQMQRTLDRLKQKTN